MFVVATQKTAIESSTDLYDYDINAGWPEVFK